MPSHASLITPTTPSTTNIKREPSPPPSSSTHPSSIDARTTTATALAELLAASTRLSAASARLSPPLAPLSSSSSSQSSSSTTTDVRPLWVDTRLHHRERTNSTASPPPTTSSPAPLVSFPTLASMKRPLWRMGTNDLRPLHVPMQPLPSIAQLSKLAVSSGLTDRLSPTAIDSVSAADKPTSPPQPPHQPTLIAPAPAPAPLSPAAASTTAAAAPTPPPPTSVNHSRKRQKDELDRLRVQVQELQRELEHVRARQSLRVPTIRLNGSASTATGALSTGPSSAAVWERIATHQKEQKSRSEMENMKLKAMVTEQIKISKALEKLVNKRCKTSSLDSKFNAKRLRVCDANELQIFDALALAITHRYPLAQTMLSTFFSPAMSKREGDGVQMILDPQHGPTMEMRSATIFPFSVDAIAAAVWRSMESEALGCAESLGLIESLLIQCTSDTICAKTTVPFRQSRAPDAALCIRVVVKRFIENERVVILWESISDCLGTLPLTCPLFAAAALSMAPLPRNVEMRDRGWCVIEALPTPNPHTHSSILQLCSHITPRAGAANSTKTEGDDVDATLTLQHMQGLVDSFAPCYRFMWENRRQTMENILMENVVGMPRPAASVWQHT